MGGFTLVILGSVERVMRGLIRGAILRGRLVVVVRLLIRMGHIRTKHKEATRARRERAGTVRPFISF